LGVRKLLAVTNVILAAGYPVVVYFGLLHLGPRSLGLCLLALLVPGLVYRLRHTPRHALWAVIKLPLAVGALVALAAVFDDRRFVLALPVAINLLLLAGFASSLRETPMIERFARLSSPELSPDQVRYCRRVTHVWCAFFVINAAVSLSLACFGSVESWAVYNGLISYLLIGVLGGSEYVVRKARFREYGRGLHDRLLSRLFPPPARANGSLRTHVDGSGLGRGGVG
jgi:uncharacterized membrane protein